MTPPARILVVDDDRLVLATVTHGLTQAGYQVYDADNGDEAILLARQHRPDLALLDIRMEGKSGFDVAETLRDAYRIPFMFLSAFSDPATLAQVKALGALDYLVKPLDVGQIVPSVAAALRRAREMADKVRTAAPPLEARAAPQLSQPTPPAAAEAAPASAPAPAPSPAAAPGAVAAAPSAGPLSDPVPLALGVLMHRHSLTREQAWDRLQRMAQAQAHSLAVQAERLLGAVEELARSEI